MNVLTSAQMQAVDRLAIDRIGIPGVVLMENAGRAVAAEILQRYARCALPRALVLAGKGNNGGDGYVIARHLLDHGWDVQTVIFADRELIQGDAEVYLQALERCGGEVLPLLKPELLEERLASLGTFNVLVDALFGTGLTKPVEGLFRQAIDWLNRQASPVVAVDIPSGIDGSTGRVLGSAVQADLTVSFAFPKIGQVTYPGAAHVGELVVVPIGLPRQALAQVEETYRFIDAEEARGMLPARILDGHKGTFGHLLVVAGSVGKSGAAAMAAESGLRGGAGLVTLACPQSVQPLVASQLTEVMTVPLDDCKGEVDVRAGDALLALCQEMQAMAVGPGLGTGVKVRSLIRRLIQDSRLPLVIDADGLNALCGQLQILERQGSQEIVLTPHPGEMARLTGSPVAEIQADRFQLARSFAMRYQVVLVLKGARTLIAAPDGRVHVNGSGHVGMASGGMGDVLTGLIGSFLAQGLPAMTAATLGVYLHGFAADRLLATLGDAGLLATDVMRELPASRRALTRES